MHISYHHTISHRPTKLRIPIIIMAILVIIRISIVGLTVRVSKLRLTVRTLTIRIQEIRFGDTLIISSISNRDDSLINDKIRRKEGQSCSLLDRVEEGEGETK
jgi:hypothetical protein